MTEFQQSADKPSMGQSAGRFAIHIRHPPLRVLPQVHRLARESEPNVLGIKPAFQFQIQFLKPEQILLHIRRVPPVHEEDVERGWFKLVEADEHVGRFGMWPINLIDNLHCPFDLLR